MTHKTCGEQSTRLSWACSDVLESYAAGALFTTSLHWKRNQMLITQAELLLGHCGNDLAGVASLLRTRGFVCSERWLRGQLGCSPRGPTRHRMNFLRDTNKRLVAELPDRCRRLPLACRMLCEKASWHPARDEAVLPPVAALITRVCVKPTLHVFDWQVVGVAGGEVR